MDKISPELDYTTPKFNHSQVQFRNVAPQGSSSVITSVTSSVGPTEIVISPACFNLSKSRLNFSMLAPFPAETYFTYINANTLTAISRITLYDSATNAVWADISNVNQYTSLLTPACTDFKEYSTKAWNPVVATTVSDARKFTVEDISKCNVASGQNNDAGNNEDMSIYNPYFGRRQFYIGAVGNAGGTTGRVAIDVSIPLSAFKLSVLSSDKLMYCPANLVLQIYWAPNTNYSFIGTSATNPTTNAANLASGIEISNISLTLANETNLEVISKVIDTVMNKGLSLPIAYPTVTSQAVTNSAAHSYQLSLTRGYGNRILALITSPFSAAAGANNVNVHSRGNLTQYNTFLNNVAVKAQGGFSNLASQDFIIGNKKYLEGSVIQTLGEYVVGDWLHVDSFFGERPIKDIDQHEIDGLDVGIQSSTWQIQATLSQATDYKWTTIIVGQKQLTISNQGSLVQ
jgi:hypothetical protein